MSDRLNQALEFANYRQTLSNQLHKAKIKAEGHLLISKNGGTFVIDQTLICFLDYLVRTGSTSSSILDKNNIPIDIDNTEIFLKEVRRTYLEVTADYSKEYQRVKKLRNVKSIIDIKDSE